MEPLRLALAIDDPGREADVLSLIQDPSFRVDGRPCQARELCASVPDVWAAVSGVSVEAVVVASTLNAIPFATLRDLASTSRRVVVLAPDPHDARWQAFPAPVVSMQPDAPALAEALKQATGRGARPPTVRATLVEPLASVQVTPTSEVIAVTSGYAADGRTTVASSLAFALGAVADTVLVDADMRSGTLELVLGLDPGRNMCLLAQQQPDAPADWDAALRTELQPMGVPSRRGVVLVGIAKPSLRPWVTPSFFEHLLGALRERFQYVVLDTAGAGWSPDDGAVDRLCLRLADRLLMVLRPDTQGVTRARRVLREWPELNRVVGVLNQAGMPGQYERAEVEAALGIAVGAVLPADPRGVASARARHRPVVCQPGCRLARRFLELASRIQGGQPLKLAVDDLSVGGRSWWRRLPLTAAGSPW